MPLGRSKRTDQPLPAPRCGLGGPESPIRGDDEDRATSSANSRSDSFIHPSGIGASRTLVESPCTASHPSDSSTGMTSRNSRFRRRSGSVRGRARRSAFTRRSTALGWTSQASHELPFTSLNRRYDIAPPSPARPRSRKGKTCAEKGRGREPFLAAPSRAPSYDVERSLAN